MHIAWVYGLISHIQRRKGRDLSVCPCRCTSSQCVVGSMLCRLGHRRTATQATHFRPFPSRHLTSRYIFAFTHLTSSHYVVVAPQCSLADPHCLWTPLVKLTLASLAFLGLICCLAVALWVIKNYDVYFLILVIK